MFRQEGRDARLSTVLGPDALVLVRFDATEAVNAGFDLRVEALTQERNLDFDRLLGTHAGVVLESPDQGQRHFDGIVAQVAWAGSTDQGYRYDLSLRPWTWVANLRRNQRIFHDKTAPQILETLFSDYAGLGSPTYEMRLTGTYPVLEYTVQYRESDDAFARRLMERFGIGWHFRHDDGNHVLVLTDTIADHGPAPGTRRTVVASEMQQRGLAEVLWDWAPERRITTGAVRLTDWNFKTPLAAMETDAPGPAAHAQGRIESFDWPGDYLDQAAGQGVARRRTDAETAGQRHQRASGSCVTLAAGMQLSVEGAMDGGLTAEPYLCLEARHSYHTQGYTTGSFGGEGMPSYRGAYVFAPASAPLAPARRQAAAVVQGPQTAVVVGEGEIDCDEYGRILVRFHWDLAAAHSMRCRVSQSWSGNGWGGMVIPRVGMEVVVEFLEGDPDKPLVTGCVYNGRNAVPYALPEHKTKSVFRTNTHNGQGFNELSFEDANGIEKIYLHAQRDLAVKVENHATERVDHNKITSVGGARIDETLLSSTTSVGHNLTFNAGVGAAARVVTGRLATSAFGIAAAGYFVEDLASLSSGGGQFVVNASGTITLNADQSFLTDVTHSAIEDIGQNFIRTVGADARTATAGSSTDTTGKVKTIEAFERLHLRCGASEIEMTPDGTITIRGLNLIVKEDALVKVTAGQVELN